MTLIDLCGQRFGSLQVVCLSAKTSTKGEKYWLCECDCGGITHAKTYDLKVGKKNCCPECSRNRRYAPAREAAAERARQKELEAAEKARRKAEARAAEDAKKAHDIKRFRDERQKAQKAAQENFGDCRSYMGDWCAGLTEMFCVSRGKCKFYKSKNEGEGNAQN